MQKNVAFSLLILILLHTGFSFTARFFISPIHRLRPPLQLDALMDDVVKFFISNNDNEIEDKPTPKVDEDPVEKLFSFFWGEKEDSPAGLARFGRDKYPEQYPCTKTEWASLLPSDRANRFEQYRPMLARTMMEKREMKLRYDANSHGWSAASFHSKVDKLGASLMILETVDGQICGGYNPKGWVSYGEYRSSIAAFLFSFDVSNSTPLKLEKVGGKGLAVIDEPESGPKFGADSLLVNLSTKMASSKLGSYYERRPDETNSLFKSRKAQMKLKSCLIFTGVYEDGEEIPFSDAEPFALY